MKNIITFLMRHVPRPILIRFSYIFNRLAPIFYKGNNQECPVCNHTFRTFLPYGAVKRRDNVLCPSCLSLERHRLLQLFLQRKTDFYTAPQSVLHIAPEQCFYGRFRKLSNLQYLTADLESPIADVKMDIHEMPFEDNRFDVVLCNHVLEHVNNDAIAMKEIFRVLKPGAWAVMQVPLDVTKAETYEDWSITSPEEREIHFWQKDHVRLFGRDYPNRLEKAGFQVTPVSFWDELSPELRSRYGLMPEEIIYWCHKPLN